MSKRIYLALPANDTTLDWQGLCQFLMILELNADTIEQLNVNLKAAEPLESARDIANVNFNFRGEFKPLGLDHEGTQASLKQLQANANLQVTYGNFEHMIDRHEGFVIFTVDSPPSEHIHNYGITYDNEMRITPFAHPTFSFGGSLEARDANNWSTHEEFTRADITRIQEAFRQHQ